MSNVSRLFKTLASEKQSIIANIHDDLYKTNLLFNEVCEISIQPSQETTYITLKSPSIGPIYVLISILIAQGQNIELPCNDTVKEEKRKVK